MRIAGPEALGSLLVSRLTADGQVDGSVTIRDLLRTFLPYHVVRGALGLTMKVEYDLVLLRFLGSDEHVRLDPEVAAAVRSELATPEPGIGFLSDLGDARVDVRPDAWAMWSGGQRPPEVAVEDGRDSTEDDPPAVVASATHTTQRCRRCARALPEDREIRFCPICGADQAEPTCPGCSEELERGWVYCPRCGRTIEK
jgi:RNA polymerase subunit RPABC4/transcription elongation factor Spt4